MRIKLHGYRLILKMHSLFVLIALLLTVVNGMKPSMAKSVNNQINNPSNGRQCNEAPVNDCNCHCNLHQDSSLKYAIEALETKMEHLIALVNKTSIPKSSSSAAEISSCKEQYERDNSSKSQMYALKFGFQEVPVYCHMGDFGCGNGGWTLTMKIDGTKGTFRYDSPFWSDRNVHNLAGGKTGFDHQETKLPSYWSTPFSKICLGMKIGHQNKFITINKDANSLFSLIADGSYLATSIGRNTWKELIGSQASLQQFCNKEGFNAKCTDSSRSKARIGIVTNNGKQCHSCDSRIGFGTGGHPDDWNTCGNEAVTFPDNGDAHIKTMGYILVQ